MYILNSLHAFLRRYQFSLCLRLILAKLRTPGGVTHFIYRACIVARRYSTRFAPHDASRLQHNPFLTHKAIIDSTIVETDVISVKKIQW
jgi:hypothetical protein